VSDRKKTLLLVDDDFYQLTLRKLVLELSGFTVVTAADAHQGMQLFETEAPDAVIVDYEMPKVSGDVLARKIRRANHAIPILMLSGCGSVPISALAAVNAFLPKGIHPSVLLNAIQCLVEAAEVFA
jgi:DNA-binding response OmpR family regulator